MPRPDADRNLLFGILALQMDFITRDALIGAMNAWALEKHRPLGDLLADRGALDPADRALLDPMVDRHVLKHGGDPLASLAALNSAGGVAADLRREVADPDVHASLASVPPGRDDPYATRATLPPEPPPTSARFRKVREHAAGNLGVVYVARDEELNREVALKEIKEKNADHLHSQAKFLLEAEVTGGLEHPGIVPVYGLGHHEDGRPFYAMRFIRGKSLLDAIRRFHSDDTLKSDSGRRTLALQRLLRRFTDVCNAVAYAHSRGVLHRDLKPDNVMVGKYGETLVVDWGLAKTTGRSGEPAAVADPDDHLPEASLHPSTADHLEETQAGSLVGTPAYMSPEQAAGRLDLLGPASDIYGLGATLYHLIVGRPPVSGTTLADLLARIQTGEIPRPRSLAPWLDPALEAICLKAMAREPGSRYATPRALAEDLDRWIAGEPVAAYPEPWARRARRWARRHSTGLVTATTAAAVASLMLGGITWSRIAQRQRTDSLAHATMEGADRLAIEARANGDLGKWVEAVGEARRAEAQLDSGTGSPALRREAKDRLARILAARDAEARNRRTIASLESARLLVPTREGRLTDAKARHDAYLAAFRASGFDVASHPIEEVATKIRTSPIADDLIAALDDWAAEKPANIPTPRLAAIARAAETDPKRASIRDAVARGDIASLRRLCEKEEDRSRLGPRLRLIFDSLLKLDRPASLPVLEAIRREHASDFWFNIELGQAYENTTPRQYERAIRYISAAVSLRPASSEVHQNLGYALDLHGDLPGAVAELREAIRLRPGNLNAHALLGGVLKRQGDPVGALAEYREAIRLGPGEPELHFSAGALLLETGDRSGASAEFREASRHIPDGEILRSPNPPDVRSPAVQHASVIRNGLALHFTILGEWSNAVAEHRKAVRLNPGLFVFHRDFGNTLFKQGDMDGAALEYSEAIRIEPADAESYCNVGMVLNARGQFRDALKNFELGHEKGTKRPNWPHKSEEWVRNGRRMVELEAKAPSILKGEATPKDADERMALADVCYKTGRHAAAARFAGEAFAEVPSLADDLTKDLRYNAACSAALAGTGRGRDDLATDEAGRIRLRGQSLNWLRADLAAWTRTLDGMDELTRRKAVAAKIAHWKEDMDLAGIRDEAALANLPEPEREAFRSLWADVDRFLAKARAAS